MIEFYINYQAVAELAKLLEEKARELYVEASKEAPINNNIIGISGLEIGRIMHLINRNIFEKNSLSIKHANSDVRKIVSDVLTDMVQDQTK